MAWGDQPKSKGTDICHGLRNDLLIAARQVKTASNRMERDRWKAGLSVLEDIDDAGV